MDAPFSGNKKTGQSILHAPEQGFIRWAVPKVPKWIQTNHLTLASIPISLAIILFSFLAKDHIQWLWGASFFIAFQWLTDSLDGAVGRARNTGLVRWGYYMDHLLDYFFLTSIMIGYMVLLPDQSKWIFFFVFALVAGFMVNSFLVMAATNVFRISHVGVGPTEIRILFIVTNTLLIIFGRTYLSFYLPYVLTAVFLGLIILVYREQKQLWIMDMQNKVADSSIKTSH